MEEPVLIHQEFEETFIRLDLRQTKAKGLLLVFLSFHAKQNNCSILSLLSFLLIEEALDDLSIVFGALMRLKLGKFFTLWFLILLEAFYYAHGDAINLHTHSSLFLVFLTPHNNAH